MSESVLAGQLRELVAAGLLSLTPYREVGRVPARVSLDPPCPRTLGSLGCHPGVGASLGGKHPVVSPELFHLTCGNAIVPELGCGSCGRWPVTARNTETIRATDATFAAVAVSQLHRRTVRAGSTSDDPLSYHPKTMEILGDRWSTVALAAAILGIRRFADFETELGAAPSIIANRLRRYGELEVLETQPAGNCGARPEYRLTSKGMAFFPVFALRVDWAHRWHADDASPTLALRHRHCDAAFVSQLRCDLLLRREEIRFEFGPTIAPA
jgi:DNA-binding HxlR family transcriptional regulator